MVLEISPVGNPLFSKNKCLKDRFRSKSYHFLSVDLVPPSVRSLSCQLFFISCSFSCRRRRSVDFLCSCALTCAAIECSPFRCTSSFSSRSLRASTRFFDARRCVWHLTVILVGRWRKNTQLDVLLTAWPPGPLPRMKVSSISDSWSTGKRE